MSKNQKQALAIFMVGLGIIVLIIGALTELYDVTHGLIAALAIWILTGVIAKALGLNE